MRPNSVRMPVAYTTARPVPVSTDVPASSRLVAVSGESSSLGPACRILGRDSPVIVALLTRRPNASIRRQSAGTLSPSPTSTTSPGTSPSAGICCTLPSRVTVTCWGSSSRRAAMARSARYSCQKEKMPLMTMTPTIAQPSRAIPCPGSYTSATKQSAAASQRMMAKKWVNSRARRSGSPTRATSSRWLGPNSASRRRASAADNPAGLEERLARTSSARSLVIATGRRSRSVQVTAPGTSSSQGRRVRAAFRGRPGLATIAPQGGCSSMVEHELPKRAT